MTDKAADVAGFPQHDLGSFSPLQLPPPPTKRRLVAQWLSPTTIAGAAIGLTCGVIGTLVAVTVIGGDTVPVLVAGQDIAPGQELSGAVVETRDVSVGESAGEFYSGSLGEGFVLARPVGEGDPVPQSAVVPAASLPSGKESVRWVSVAVPAEESAGLVAGSVVDVWVTPPDRAESRRASMIAPDVTVARIDDGAPGRVAVVLSLVKGGNADAADLESLVARVIAAGRDGRLYFSEVPSAD